MTRRTPGRTAGYDNRRPIRSPFIPLRNTPITGWNKPDRYTSRLTAQRARYHHEIRARSHLLALTLVPQHAGDTSAAGWFDPGRDRRRGGYQRRDGGGFWGGHRRVAAAGVRRPGAAGDGDGDRPAYRRGSSSGRRG